MKSIINVGVPPGIGDGLWALTKVEQILRMHGGDKAQLVIADSPPLRSREFLGSFSFVASAEYHPINFHNPANSQKVLPDWTFDYITTRRNWNGLDWWLMPNFELEHGMRLEEWLPEYETDWNIGER